MTLLTVKVAGPCFTLNFLFHSFHITVLMVGLGLGRKSNQWLMVRKTTWFDLKYLFFVAEITDGDGSCLRSWPVQVARKNAGDVRMSL